MPYGQESFTEDISPAFDLAIQALQEKQERDEIEIVVKENSEKGSLFCL